MLNELKFEIYYISLNYCLHRLNIIGLLRSYKDDKRFECQLLQHLCDQTLQKYRDRFGNMMEEFAGVAAEEKAHTLCSLMFRELLATVGINWKLFVLLICFSGAVCEHLISIDSVAYEDCVYDIAENVADFLSSSEEIRTWFENNGKWRGMLNFYVRKQQQSSRQNDICLIFIFVVTLVFISQTIMS